MRTFKTLVFAIVCCILPGCSGADRYNSADGPCATVPAKRFGGFPCLLQIPAGVDCLTSTLMVDGVPALADVEFNRHCEIEHQISVTGGACSALERGSVASIGCVRSTY